MPVLKYRKPKSITQIESASAVEWVIISPDTWRTASPEKFNEWINAEGLEYIKRVHELIDNNQIKIK